MQFPESWLREFCNPPLTTQALADLLTMSGMEVEELQPVAPPFSKIVVGEILEAVQHPNADKLRVCKVDAGEHSAQGPLQIVCGAPNARAGIRVPLALVDRLEKFPSEKLEQMADSWVVQYRDSLLRVVALSKVLGSGGDECMHQKSVNVIVVRRGGRAVGLAVDRIIDVQQGVVAAPSPTSATGLLATFVLNGVATELMDLPQVLEVADPVWQQQQWIAKAEGPPVLVGTSSRFVGTSLRQYLELGGYPATVREIGPDLLKSLESTAYRAVIVEWPTQQDENWVESLHNRTASSGIPVIGVAESDTASVPDWISRLCPPHDRQSLLRMLELSRQGETAGAHTGVTQ